MELVKKMKLKNAGAIFFAFMLCLSTSLCFLIGFNLKNAVSDGLYIMSMRKEQSFFNLNDIELLEKENQYFTFTKSLYIEVSSGISKDETEIVGTNENFAEMARLNIISGSFFNKMHITKRSNVVVLSSAAAWKFFGDKQSIGNFLYVNDEAYQVIGIFENDFAHKDKILLYMPFENLSQHFLGSPAISDIWIKLRDISQFGLITTMMGYLSDDVLVFQMEKYKDVVMLRFRIIVFIVGAVIIVFLWKRILRSLKVLGQELTLFFEKNYISDILFLFKQKSFLLEFLFAISYMLLFLLLLQITPFKLCIPYNDLAAGRFDFSVLSSILNFYIQPYIEIPALLYLNDLNVMSCVLFFVSILSGLGFVYSLYIIKQNRCSAKTRLKRIDSFELQRHFNE